MITSMAGPANVSSRLDQLSLVVIMNIVAFVGFQESPLPIMCVEILAKRNKSNIGFDHLTSLLGEFRIVLNFEEVFESVLGIAILAFEIGLEIMKLLGKTEPLAPNGPDIDNGDVLGATRVQTVLQQAPHEYAHPGMEIVLWVVAHVPLPTVFTGITDVRVVDNEDYRLRLHMYQ